MTMRYDLIGRKAILAFFDLKDWRSVAARIRDGAPIKKERAGGRWVAVSGDLREWLDENP